LGLRPKLNVKTLPGTPDLVFPSSKLVVFCDGDFWHGRNLAQRTKRLEAGHNAPYWVAKISANVTRDRRHNAALRQAGWRVLRFWESQIAGDTDAVALTIWAIIQDRRPLSRMQTR
jgi:DNA mismatch endonuclease (patch repair protein)